MLGTGEGGPRASGRVGRALRLVGRSIACGTGGIIARGFVTVKRHNSVFGVEGEMLRNLVSEEVNAKPSLASSWLSLLKIRLNRHFKNKSSPKSGKSGLCNSLPRFLGHSGIGTRAVTSVTFVKPVSWDCQGKGVLCKSSDTSNLENHGKPKLRRLRFHAQVLDANGVLAACRHLQVDA
jgi:hypothetical protein